jgi:uncharacterized repeat protein (TIGR01451 family)
MRSGHAIWTRFAIVALALGLSGASGVQAARAGAGAGWELTARTFPTNLAPGHRGTVEVDVFNLGAADSSGEITVTDTLPPGVTAVEAGDLRRASEPEEPLILVDELWDCTGNGPGEAVLGASVVTCKNDPVNFPTFAGGGGDGNRGDAPYPQPQIGIAVSVAPNAEEGVRAGPRRTT